MHALQWTFSAYIIGCTWHWTSCNRGGKDDDDMEEGTLTKEKVVVKMIGGVGR